MTTSTSNKIIWGTVGLFVLLFAFMFMYTDTTWNVEGIKIVGQGILALVALASVFAFIVSVVTWCTRCYRNSEPWDE